MASLAGTYRVLATALLNDQLFVTCESVAAVSVYDTSHGSLRLTSTITFSGLGTVLYGLATSAIDNYLYVSDFLTRVVHRVDLSVTSTVSVVTWSASGGPYGLSMTSENTVLVATFSSAINEYTPSGSLVRNITTSSIPYQAVQVNNNVWAFTQFGPVSQICTVLTTGTVIKCFGSMAGPGLTLAMNYPQAMVIDARGYLLVGDCHNNRMLLVDPTLTSAGQLQLPVNPTLNYPQTVSYELRRQLVVCTSRLGWPVKSPRVRWYLVVTDINNKHFSFSSCLLSLMYLSCAKCAVFVYVNSLSIILYSLVCCLRTHAENETLIISECVFNQV